MTHTKLPLTNIKVNHDDDLWYQYTYCNKHDDIVILSNVPNRLHKSPFDDDFNHKNFINFKWPYSEKSISYFKYASDHFSSNLFETIQQPIFTGCPPRGYDTYQEYIEDSSPAYVKREVDKRNMTMKNIYEIWRDGRKAYTITEPNMEYAELYGFIVTKQKIKNNAKSVNQMLKLISAYENNDTWCLSYIPHDLRLGNIKDVIYDDNCACIPNLYIYDGDDFTMQATVASKYITQILEGRNINVPDTWKACECYLAID